MTFDLRITNGSSNRRLTYIIIIVSYTLFLAYLSTAEFVKMVMPMLHTWEGWHQGHMANMAYAPLQYRVLSYLIPEIMVRSVGVSVATAYLIERFVFTFLSCLVFHFFCRKWLSDCWCIACNTLFILLYSLATFAHLQPAEELNLLALVLGYYAIREHRFFLLLTVVAVGAFNKSTVVFLIPFWLTFELLSQSTRDIARLAGRAALLCLVFFSIYLGIRYCLGTDRVYIGYTWQTWFNVERMTKPAIRAFHWLLPSFVPAAIIAATWKRQPQLMRAFIPTIFLFAVGHFLISRVEEFRTFMGLAFVTIPAVVIWTRDLLEHSGASPGQDAGGRDDPPPDELPA